MPAKPGPLYGVIGTPRRDEAPEPGTVSEDAHMGELVDDHRLERAGRREDETPREHQATLARCAAPTAARIPQDDRAGRHAERRRVERDRLPDRLGRPGAEPGLDDLLDRVPISRRLPDHQLVARLGTHALDR